MSTLAQQFVTQIEAALSQREHGNKSEYVTLTLRREELELLVAELRAQHISGKVTPEMAAFYEDEG